MPAYTLFIIHHQLTSAQGQLSSLLPTPSPGEAWNAPALISPSPSHQKTYGGRPDPWFPISQTPEPGSHTSKEEQKMGVLLVSSHKNNRVYSIFCYIYIIKYILVKRKCTISAYTLNVPSAKLLNFFSCADRPSHMLTRSCTGILRPLFLSIGY